MTRWTRSDLDAVRRKLHDPDQIPRKYGNQILEVDGHRFESKLELCRYRELQQMVKAGLISDLAVHPEFALHAPTRQGVLERVGAYIADFRYQRDGKLVIEDCKSIVTRRLAIYRWKREHLRIEYGVEVIEIGKRRT